MSNNLISIYLSIWHRYASSKTPCLVGLQGRGFWKTPGCILRKWTEPLAKTSGDDETSWNFINFQGGETNGKETLNKALCGGGHLAIPSHQYILLPVCTFEPTTLPLQFGRWMKLLGASGNWMSNTFKIRVSVKENLPTDSILDPLLSHEPVS